MNPTQELYRGALLGAAIGDALGVATDGFSREEIKKKFGVHRELSGGGRLGLKPGETSDLTELLMASGEHLLEAGKTDPKELIKVLAAVDGVGRDDITHEALSGYKPRGRDIFASGKKALDSRKGNAPLAHAVPRLAAVALFRRLLFKELTDETILACQITHQDQRTIDAGIAFNFGTSYLTSGKDPSKLLFKTWRFLTDSRAAALYMETVSEQTPAEDMVLALKSVNDAQYDDLQANGNAIEMVKAAYWLTLEAIDFEEGMLRAANMGGSTMLMGCIAGSLLGARFGIQAVPERWVAGLAQRARLESLADKLWKASEPKK